MANFVAISASLPCKQSMEAAAPPPADAPEPAAKRQKVDASALPTLKPWKTNVSVAVASHAGKRAAMEDAHCVVHADQFAALIAEAGGDVPAGARVALYGVLDGHNGKRVAELCCRTLPAHVARELALLLRQQARQPARAVSDKAPVHCWHSKKRVEAALRRACARVEADAAASGFDAEGCCCVAALLIQDECHVLNLGDSRAVLARAPLPPRAAPTGRALRREPPLEAVRLSCDHTHTSP